MPTVILLDVSLSMSRSVAIPDCAEEYQRRHLAIQGINTFLDHLSTSFKLEFTSLMVYSSLWENVIAFTRDYDSIRTALNKIEEHDKTCLLPAINGIHTLFLNEWGSSMPGQVIVITDGTGSTSLQRALAEQAKDDTPKVPEMRGLYRKKAGFPLPFPFNCKLHFMCIANQGEPALQVSLPLYQRLIEINGQGGEVYLSEGPLSMKSVQSMFTRLAENYFVPFNGMLRCGNLNCHIQLFPPPEKYVKTSDFDHIERVISSDIDIFGFLDIADIASPPIVSRHLVVPLSSQKADNKNQVETKDEEEESKATDAGKAPSFTVLLHGSLKVEGMIALAQVGEDWFGMLYSWADSKKKSNLMLSIFEPGDFTLPWLGRFKHLAPIQEFPDPPYGEDDNTTPFPVRQARRSYAQNSTVWIRTAGLQADVQKILRHARKLPEKQQNFYRELNRLRRMAVSLGFLELLEAMAGMLERECTLLPGHAHPAAALQLGHAATALRNNSAKEIGQNITPMKTSFDD